MKHALILAILAIPAGAVMADGDRKELRGDYVEARTCAVWTGSCFANGEVNLMGKNAVIGWSVKEGSFDGVALDGLKVVAVLDAEGTLHTKYEGKVVAIVFVDGKATDRQADALVAMAKSLAPDHLADIRKVERKAIEFSRKGLEAAVTVAKEIQVKTAEICACENTTCHAYLFYPAFSKSTQVESAKSLAHSYQGDQLGVRWSDPERQSAMVGSFAK